MGRKIDKLLKNKIFRFILISLVMILSLEVFVFNMPFFNKTKPVHIPIEETNLIGLEQIEGNIYQASMNNPILEFNNINQELSSIRLPIDFLNNNRLFIDVVIYYTDATRSVYTYSDAEFKIVKGYEESQRIKCAYNGATESLRLDLRIDEGEQIILNGLIINENIVFHISLIRVIVIFSLSLMIYLSLKIISIPIIFTPSSIFHRSYFRYLGFGFIVLMMILYALYVGFDYDLNFRNYDGDQISKEMVDMFKDGRVYIAEAEEELLALDNPYEWYQRDEIPSYMWDHVLYNGKYYSYYGVTPVFTLFLPYNLITGYYLQSSIGTLFFSIIGVILLCEAYLKLLTKYLKNVPLVLGLCGLTILLFSSGVLQLVTRPQFYELSEACALCFFAGSLYFLFNSNILTKDKLNLKKIFLSSTFLALAILARATYVLYVFPYLIWLTYGLIDYYRANKKVFNIIKFLVITMLPLAVLGLLQMIYNYVRFGSIFEFGIKYSLTINDFRNTTFHPLMAIISIFNLFFAIPVFKMVFPFLHGNVQNFNLNGFYFFETDTSFGLFIRTLPLFIFFYLPSRIKKISYKNIMKSSLLIVFPCLIIPIIIAGLSWESGHAVRYFSDFSAIMIMGALYLIFKLYNQLNQPYKKSIFNKVLLFCTLWCIIANILFVFQRVPSITNTIYINENGTALYYKIARALEFWR